MVQGVAKSRVIVETGVQTVGGGEGEGGQGEGGYGQGDREVEEVVSWVSDGDADLPRHIGSCLSLVIHTHLTNIAQ